MLGENCGVDEPGYWINCIDRSRCRRAYSKEFFVVHNFKSSCMMQCTNSIQSNNKLEKTS